MFSNVYMYLIIYMHMYVQMLMKKSPSEEDQIAYESVGSYETKLYCARIGYMYMYIYSCIGYIPICTVLA